MYVADYYRRMAEQTATVRTRRRGKQLEDALYDATLAELAAVGYGGLTMEGIAARARTGKAALYRRWSSKHDLVQAALLYALPPLPEQQRIVRILDAADELRRLRDQAERRTADLIPAIFHEMFGDPATRTSHQTALRGR